MKDKKIFFFDIDGTLIDSSKGQHSITTAVKEQLDRLKHLGYETIIATGRPRAFINKNLLSAGFSGMILCNGAHVELDGKTIYRNIPDADQTHLLIQRLNECGCQYVIETEDYSYIDSSFSKSLDFFVREDINKDKIIYDFDVDNLYGSILKLELTMSKKNVDIVPQIIPDCFHYDGYGTEFFMEIFAKDSSKAKGMEIIVEKLQGTRENTWAFGDGINDIEMIQYAGHGVAMGNACDELKAIADEVCKPISKNGLVKYLVKIK